MRRSHVDVAAELRAFGDDDLRRLDVAVDGGAGDELDAVIGRDVAGHLPFDVTFFAWTVASMRAFVPTQQIAGEIDLAVHRSFDRHRLVAGDRSFDRDVRTEERAVRACCAVAGCVGRACGGGGASLEKRAMRRPDRVAVKIAARSIARRPCSTTSLALQQAPRSGRNRAKGFPTSATYEQRSSSSRPPSSPAAAAASKDEQYKTEKVDRGNMTMTVTATGTLSAVTTVQVGSQVSGVIARLYADFNSHVKKGQLLAELDPTPFQAAGRAAAGRRDEGAGRGGQRQDQLRPPVAARRRPASPRRPISTPRKRAVRRRAARRSQQADAALQQAHDEPPLHEDHLADRRRRRRPPVRRRADRRRVVPGADALLDRPGPHQDAGAGRRRSVGHRPRAGRASSSRFTVDAYPDEEFRGRISQIRLNATGRQNVVTYPVIIEVPNPDEKLRPKMTANVTIEVASVHDVLRIPNAALRFKPGGRVQEPATKRRRRATLDHVRRRRTRTARMAQMRAERRQRRSRAARPEPLGRGWRRDDGGAAAEEDSRPIYILDADKKPQPVEIRTGITDGRYTQVVDGELKEGDQESSSGWPRRRSKRPAAVRRCGGAGRRTARRRRTGTVA